MVVGLGKRLMELHPTTVIKAEIYVVGKETKVKVKQTRLSLNGDKFLNPENKNLEVLA